MRYLTWHQGSSIVLSEPRSNPESSSNGLRRKDGLLTTGDMARQSANTLRTVRFYEETGLLTPVQRTDGGHRLFEKGELRKLQLISDLRAAGFSLEEIKEMIEAKLQCNCGADASRNMIGRLDRQIDAMTDRVMLLQRLLGELRHTRDMLAQCNACSSDQRFPDGCSDCKVMTDVDDIPNAVSVLWHVDR